MTFLTLDSEPLIALVLELDSQVFFIIDYKLLSRCFKRLGSIFLVNLSVYLVIGLALDFKSLVKIFSLTFIELILFDQILWDFHSHSQEEAFQLLKTLDQC